MDEAAVRGLVATARAAGEPVGTKLLVHAGLEYGAAVELLGRLRAEGAVPAATSSAPRPRATCRPLAALIGPARVLALATLRTGGAVSAETLMRGLRVSYDRAGQLVDQLRAEGRLTLPPPGRGYVVR